MNRISNYDELVAARVMTEAIIADRKRIIHERVTDVKKKIAPLMLLKVGSFVAIDLLIGRKLLKRAGWVTRLLIPTLLKTFSLRVIERVKKD